jgi:hypothetical protein
MSGSEPEPEDVPASHYGMDIIGAEVGNAKCDCGGRFCPRKNDQPPPFPSL